VVPPAPFLEERSSNEKPCQRQNSRSSWGAGCVVSGGHQSRGRGAVHLMLSPSGSCGVESVVRRRFLMRARWLVVPQLLLKSAICLLAAMMIEKTDTA
jgi:hypothetical protein